MDIKKIVASVTAAAIVATQALSAVAMAGTTTSYPAEWVEAVQFMKEEGLSSTANSVEEYMPLATVKREAAAKFFVNFAKKEFGRTADTTKECVFADINEANPVFVPYIIEACQMGILKGVNGKFLPKATLTKLQFLTVLARIVKNDPSIEPAQAFNLLKADGITKEATLADTVRPVTRIELAILFKRAVEKYVKTQEENNTQEGGNENADTGNIGDILGSILGGDEEENTDNNEDNTQEENNNQENNTQEEDNTEDNNQTAGEDKLVVALDPATPKTLVVSKTAKHVKVMKFDLTAGDKDVTVENVTIKLNGLMDRDDIENVYVTNEDDVTVSVDKSVSSDYTATLRLKTDNVVKANTTKSLYLTVDFKAKSTRYGYFTLESVEATSSVDGDLPLRSADIQLVDYTSDKITLDAQGSTTSEKVYVGDKNVEVYKFELEEGGDDDKDSVFKAITITASGDNVEGRLDNFKLMVGGQDITKSVTIDKDEVTITVKDYVLKDGETKNFYVYADIVGGEDDDAIQFYIDGDLTDDNKKYDLSQEVVLVSNNAAVPVYSKDKSKEFGKTINIKEGDMLITKASESPTSTYIPNDENDVVVLIANFNVTSPITVKKFAIPFTVSDSNGSGVIDEIKLYLDDKLVDSKSVSWTGSATFTGIFDYDDTIEKGTHKFVVKVDTKKEADDNDSISNVIINKNSFEDAEYVDSGNDAKNDIKGEAKSATFTIKRPAVENIARTDGYADGEEIIAGIQDFMILKFTVQANNVRNLKINGFKVKALPGKFDSDGLTTLKVRYNGQIVDVENFDDGNATFNSLGITVPKGGTTDVELLVSLTNSYNSPDKLQIKVSDFDIEDSKGNTVKTDKTVTSAEFVVKSAAKLYVNRDSATPAERVLAANPNVEYEVARFKFKAVYDDAQIQELLLENKKGTEADNVIQKVYLYDTNGNKIADTSLVSGYAYFALSTPFTLPKDQETVLIVKVKPNAINDEANTNKAVKFAIKDERTGTTQKTKVVSKSNGNEITDVDSYTSAVADAQYFRKTVITVSAGNRSDTLANNTATLYEFKLTPDAAGSAKVKKIVLDFSATDAGGSATLKVKNMKLEVNGSDFVAENKVEITDQDGNDLTTSTAVTGVDITKIIITFTGAEENGYEISSETSFVLKADIEGSEDNDSISVKLNENSTDMDTHTYAELSSTDASIIWSDKAADNVTTGTKDWFTEANIPGVPAASQTLSK